MYEPSVLIAGIGNIFLGDDAFGVEVARRLSARVLPHGVRVADFGIRGLDLTYAMLYGDQDVTILVDAAPRGGTPGTVYLIEPEAAGGKAEQGLAVLDAHSMDPAKILHTVRSMGGEPKRVFVVGCEPLTLGPDEGLMGLSAPVELAVGQAADLIESLVIRILAGEPVVNPVLNVIQEGA